MTSKRAILVISIAFVLPSCSTRQVGFLSIIFTIIFCLFSTTKTKVTKTDLSVAYSGRTCGDASRRDRGYMKSALPARMC